MGMFDDIKCKYPLPVAGANDLDYQTKDTNEQRLDKYEIREDGTLWHEAYDIEDHSEFGRWQREHPGEEPKEVHLLDMCGCLARVNKRWEQVKHTGEICFYDFLQPDGWIEWSAYFVDGQLKELHLIENRPPTLCKGQT